MLVFYFCSMENVTLEVNKSYVYDEVAKTTAYVGSKMLVEDANAYDRIFTTDEDRLLLERFWVETCNVATNQFKPFLVSLNPQPISHGIELEKNYVASLELPSNFDSSLQEVISTSLFSFFVASIVSKWFTITDKPDAERYTAEAVSIMDDIMRMLFHRKRPKRK